MKKAWSKNPINRTANVSKRSMAACPISGALLDGDGEYYLVENSQGKRLMYVHPLIACMLFAGIVTL